MKETPKQRAKRKQLWIARVINQSFGAPNIKEIIQEAEDKFEKENQ